MTLNFLLFPLLFVLQVDCDDVGTFDYFTLSLEWPQGYCDGVAKGKPCVVSNDIPGWILHGLWPSSRGGKDPRNCKGAPPFKMDDIEDLRGSLAKYWPSLLTDRTNTEFWKHEYNAHGTCAKLGSVKAYFTKAVELHHKTEPLEALNSQGVYPREDAYSAEQLRHALRRAYDVDFCLLCKDNMLSELHLCYDKDFSRIDCPKCTVKCGDGKVYYRPLPGMSMRWSGGTFFFVLVLPGVVLYFVLGMLFNTFRGMQGPDIIPHRELIGELPELIFDGIMFTISVLSCSEDKPRTGGYQTAPEDDREAMVS